MNQIKNHFQIPKTNRKVKPSNRDSDENNHNNEVRKNEKLDKLEAKKTDFLIKESHRLNREFDIFKGGGYFSASLAA